MGWWSGYGQDACTNAVFAMHAAQGEPGRCLKSGNFGDCIQCEKIPTKAEREADARRLLKQQTTVPAQTSVPSAGAFWPSNPETSARAPSPANDFQIPAWYKYVSWAGAATGLYHGYKRHGGSIWWGLGWSLCGSLAPIITIPLSLAEGYGKPKGR